jgi:quercetin dioxygenase-like cupin family protein
MKRLTTAGVVCAALLLMLTLAAGTARAQDPVKAAPKLYKVLFEDEHVRVLEVKGKPGEKAPMHSHPDYVVYAISGGKVKHTAPDGKTTENEMKAGSAMWVNAESHSSEIVGPGALHVILVEMKQAPAAAKAKAPAKKM